jgi:hypothetical protein
VVQERELQLRRPVLPAARVSFLSFLCKQQDIKKKKT